MYLSRRPPRRDGDRLIPFCAIDPRTTINGGRQGVEDLLKRYVDQGCKGFGEHKPGLPIDDPLSKRLLALCGKVGLPVLFHLDDVRNTDKPGLPGLEAVLRETQQTTFIGHGPGFWASISGDVRTAADLGAYPKPPAGRSTGCWTPIRTCTATCRPAAGRARWAATRRSPTRSSPAGRTA